MPSLSIARQCELVGISRSGFYYQPSGETELNLTLMRLIDEQHMRTPYYGARQMARYLRREGYVVGRKRVRRLMQKMGLCVHLSAAAHDHSGCRSRGLPVSAAGSRD